MTPVRLREILSGLNHAGIRYVIVGGVAANVFGSPRATWDVDICYEPSPENCERLALLLLSWHACLRGVEPGLPWVLDARSLRNTAVLTLVTDLGDLDVMHEVAGVGRYEAVEQAADDQIAFDLPVKVLGLDALISAKKAAARRKDIEALLELEALREERRRRGL